MTVRHEVRLLGREPCGDDILTLRFSRPEGYEFHAGQWFTLTIDTADGPETKTFSHCSAPADAYLETTTRLSASAFKRALARLVPGDRAAIAGPGGRLSLDPDVESVCFLVGGTGITPVRSILRDAMYHDRVFADALLLYGNRDECCTPFAEEFARMSSHGVRLELCYEHPPVGWAGETGFITAETVLRHLDDAHTIPFYVAGPPVMVTAMERVLDDLGVPDEHRHVERFGPQQKRGGLRDGTQM